MKIVVAACVAALLCGCMPQTDGKGRVIRAEDLRYPRYGDEIEPVDYGNPDNWLASGGDGKMAADVFFLYPTSWSAAYGEYPICGIDNAEMRVAKWLLTR